MLHDLWYAARRLRVRPWHTLVVIAIFALGSGAALTVFRLMDAVLLRALPYASAERLVRVNMHVPLLPNAELPFSDVGYRALERRTHSFELLASYRLVGVNVTVGASSQRVMSARVTGNFFDVLGLPAQHGRLFSAGAETAHGPPQIVLSDAFWRSTFGADPDIAGTTVRLDGVAATIIGVADRRVTFPAASVGYFTLMDLDPVGTSPFQLGIDVLGRLRPGVTLRAAVAEGTHVMQEVAHENPGPHSTPESDVSGFRVIMRPIRDEIAGGIKPTLMLLAIAVVFVLILTCVNVGTLELARSSRRRAELAVRTALGAQRRRLIAGALFEGAIQAAIGVGLGLTLSAITVAAIESLLPVAFGTGTSAQMSVGVVIAALGMVMLGAAAAGAFPVIATLDADVQAALRARDGTTTRGMSQLRRALIVVQIAVACVLVHGAVLMTVSVRDAQRVALGFRTDGLFVFQLSLPRETYSTRENVSTELAAITERLRAIPGVIGVGLADRIPLDADYSDGMIAVEGRPFKADGTDPNVDQRVVSAGYLATMGIPIIAGRGFREGDDYLDGTPVIINRTMARLLWPDGGDPIGQRVRTGPFVPWMPVVGMVEDAKNRSVTAAPRAEMYLPLGAPRSPVGTTRDVAIVMRARGALALMQATAQQRIRQTNPDLPLYNARQFAEVVRGSQLRELTTMRTLTAFAVVALVLAIAGTYAMLMFSVVQRQRELALRQAIGATDGALAGMVVREMAQLLAIGTGVGLAGIAVVSRLLAAYLFGVSALDGIALAATLAIISVAGLGAALLPARRAARVDLMSLLRTE